MIKRLHNNLGHPATADMIRYLSHQECKPEALIATRALRCAVCVRSRPVQRARPSKMPRRVGSFGNFLSMDFLFLDDSEHVQHTYLSILQLSGNFHIVLRIPSRHPDKVWRLFSLG